MPVDEGRLLARLSRRKDLLQALELAGPEGQVDARKTKKLGEIAGFCEVMLQRLREWLGRRASVRIIEFSCGKSYLGLLLAHLLEEEGKAVSLTGVDFKPALVEKCGVLAQRVGLKDAGFVASRTIAFRSDVSYDVAVSLHACDTATDEAIAKAVMLDVPWVFAVPCCQNQIRGQIRTGHPLTAMTDYGPIRYRLANMLTDVLRAEFLRSAGYVVEMQEIASPRLTPKNLCICARKSRRSAARAGRDAGYRALRDLFGVKPKLEALCPGIVGDDDGRAPDEPGAAG